MLKHRIDVSREIVAYVGRGALPDADRPDDAIAFHCHAADLPLLAVDSDAGMDDDATLTIIVARAACARIFSHAPDTAVTWHLPSALRALVLAIRDCDAPGPARATLRLAKCIEMLCAVFASIHADTLVPADGAGTLSERDAARVVQARRLVDERWQEKLTIDAIARARGLNRANLTRGFRELFGSSVADAIADHRLTGAHRPLLATHLPVSSIGYRCGYSNNASFARAFARRFGVAPTRLRAQELAA